MATARRNAAHWLYANLLAALACGGGALLGLALEFGTISQHQNWPVVGIGIVVARVFGLRVVPAVWAIAYFTVDEAVTAPRTVVGSFPLQILVSAIFAGQIFLAAALIRTPRDENPVGTQRGVFQLILAALASGIAGNALRALSGWFLELSTLEIFTLFAYRVSKFFSGAILVSPLAFMVVFERRPRFSRKRWAGLFALLLLLTFATLLASTSVIPFFQTYQQMTILLVLPLTLWTTLRHGLWGATIAIFITSLIPVWGTLRGHSPFGVVASTTSEILTHLYFVTVSVTTLTIGAVLRERENLVAELREAKADLQAKVESRTEDLRRERDFGSAIFDTIGALILVARLDGTLIRLNRTSRRFLGISMEEARGKSAWELGIIPAEEVPAVRSRFEGGVGSGENHLISKDGELRLFQWTNTRLQALDDTGDDFIISIGTDITDRRKAQVEALEAIKARDLFLSVASHELRTPLTTLQLQLQSLQRFVIRLEDLPAEIGSRLELALRQTRRLGDLVNELLDVSRITHGRLTPERSEVDLPQVAREVIDRYKLSLEQSGSSLEARGFEKEICGFWDPLRIEQIVDNLISNAIKYGEGRPIVVELDRVGDAARIVVRDHGIGISTKDQQRIFDRFERAVSTRYYGGFGLGLWITRQVVEAHGGSIRVESEIGEGSTFTVDLPLCVTC